MGEPPSAEAASGAAALAGDGLEPPADVHASSSYRREMAAVMAKHALFDAIGLEGER